MNREVGLQGCDVPGFRARAEIPTGESMIRNMKYESSETVRGDREIVNCSVEFCDIP
jgi:hypothetical protein